ncbi:MAG: AAA domain-containing protein [Acidimicrobiales bacterium]
MAAAAAPVTWLDEHFRSVPHLIDFSARHFYDDELRLMTQHPSVEGQDSIDQVRVDGVRVDGVNRAEVDAVRDLIVDLAYREGSGTIGVVTPFRAQADAIVEMMLDRFSLSQIRTYGLRAGTVHSFQGSERDTMIISLGLGSDDLARSLRFVEDRGLFNVMVTRARRRIVLVHSFDPVALPPGLLADYFRFVDDPPRFEHQPRPSTVWTGRVADSLGDAGQRAVVDYPVAGWTVDIALGEGAAAFGVECAVHPDGVEAHIERHLTLVRAGWTLMDAFPSRWMLHPEEAAVHLAVELNRRVAAEAEQATPPAS